MQNFDLLDFLSHNYISLGNLVNQNMWRSYCYGDPNIWWWHHQEETEMPFGDTTYYFTENNRYRVSIWIVFSNYDTNFNTFYLYVEDLKLSLVRVYVSTLVAEMPINGFLKPDTEFQNIRIELLDDNNFIFHSYTWNNTMTLLKGQQCIPMGLFKSLLIFDSNEALLYLYDVQIVSSPELIIHFLSFSNQSISISGIEYTKLEVVNMNDSTRLYEGLNNTHTYISNMISNISKAKINKNSLHIISNVITKCSNYIVRPLSNDFPWFILFVFRPTPVIGDGLGNYDVALSIEQNFTGNHSPITRWKLNDGYSLSINCGGVFNDIFIQGAAISTGHNNYFLEMSAPGTSLFVTPDLNPTRIFFVGSYGNINVYAGIARYSAPLSTFYSCDVLFSSLFYYYGDNTENLIWLFRYDSDPNLRTAYIVYSQNMSQYDEIIGNAYVIYNIYFLGIYDKMYEYNETEDTYLTLNSYLAPNSYHTHLTQFFIFNTLAHTAPQVLNGSWAYMHYLRFVLDDYTSSNLRIPIAIVDGALENANIKRREISVDGIVMSQRYPIVGAGSLSKAHMPDVVLDGYIASLNTDAGKKEDTTFGTLIPYYDLKEASLQEPHPEWYFRIHIHAGTWYYIFKNITSITSNRQMKTYRIQYNDGNLRIVLDVGLYFEIITESISNRGQKYTIVYADIFPSVYWCYGNEAYEFLNVNVEWIQCRHSIPGESMIRVSSSNNTIIAG